MSAATIIREYSQEGAYGFPYSEVLTSRGKGFVCEVSGFQWSGNQGGYRTLKFLIPADKVETVKDMIGSGFLLDYLREWCKRIK